MYDILEGFVLRKPLGTFRALSPNQLRPCSGLAGEKIETRSRSENSAGVGEYEMVVRRKVILPTAMTIDLIAF